MSEKVEISWLSVLLEQTDRLILAIGGYDSGDDEIHVEELEDKEDRIGDDLERQQHQLQVNRDSRRSDVLLRQTEAFEDSEDDSADELEDDPGAQEHIPLKATPSPQRNIVDSPNGSIEDLAACDVTPHHSRIDKVNGPPPEVGFFRSRGGSSRRMPRESKLKHEVIERAEWNTTHQSVADRVESSNTLMKASKFSKGRANLAKAVEAGAIFNAPATGEETKKEGRKFSYASDTAWMKGRQGSLAITEPSSLLGSVPAELGTASRFGLHAADSDGRSRSRNLEQPGDYCETFASSSVPTNLTELSEMEQQLQRDMNAAPYPEAETDSEVEKLSADSPDERAASLHQGCVTEDGDGVGRHEPGVGTDVQEDLDDSHAKLDDVGVESTRHTENGTGEGLEGVDRHGESANVKIGAKRDSAGNGVGLEDGAELRSGVSGADFDDDAVPFKRGKTERVYRLGVMRHSSRLDDAVQQRKSAKTNGKETGNEAETDSRQSSPTSHNELVDSIPWPDRTMRPYDTPIIDKDLPALQAMELAELGFGAKTLVVCSPFRRCLQTAGVVARTLGVGGVTVCLEVGERMDKVRKEIAEMVSGGEQNQASLTDDLGGKVRKAVFSYLDRAGMVEALGEGVRLDRIIGEAPPEDESGVEAKQRFVATIAKLRQKLQESPVLVVAHGDTLDAAGESLASQIVYEADYCGWAVFDLDTHYGYVAESYGIQMIPL